MRIKEVVIPEHLNIIIQISDAALPHTSWSITCPVRQFRLPGTRRLVYSCRVDCGSGTQAHRHDVSLHGISGCSRPCGGSGDGGCGIIIRSGHRSSGHGTNTPAATMTVTTMVQYSTKIPWLASMCRMVRSPARDVIEMKTSSSDTSSRRTSLVPCDSQLNNYP